MAKDKKKQTKKKPDNKSPELKDKSFKVNQGDKRKAPVKVKGMDDSSKSKWQRFLDFLKKPVKTRKAYVIISMAFLIALIIVGIVLYLTGAFGLNSFFAFNKYTGPDFESPLTGVMTTEEQGSRRVVGVMIENHPQARPQSGLESAGLVYEALAEGGITRFLAFYLEADSETLGPVRSARAYYLPWAAELDSSYAHVGGSALAQSEIESHNIKDLDQFSHSQYFRRSTDRYAPHNVYTTTKKLRQAGVDEGWEDINNFESWEFKDDGIIGEKPITNISVNFSGSLYQVSYQFDKQENVYTRSMAGSPHKGIDGDPIKPKNIIVQVVEQSLSNDNQHLTMETIGSDTAYLFRDGEIIKGTWEKDDWDERTKFYLDSGEEFEFNRGQTWVHVISSIDRVSYSRK